MIDHAELFDALDEMLAAELDLRRQRRALFPAVLRRRKATGRVLACYRALKGEPPGPPDAGRPLLDAIDRAPARAAGQVVEEIPAPSELVTVEERPDGSPPDRAGKARGRKRRPLVWVEEPPEGWDGDSLYRAARRIRGKGEKGMLTGTEAADTVLCNRCNAARHRTAGKCALCGCPEYRAFSVALSEIEGRRREPVPMDDDPAALSRAARKPRRQRGGQP